MIVGDSSTFGKGTVQTMLEIGRIMPFLGSGNNEAGALKLTIQKFYRIAGGSTQHKGVESDVRLPSLFDHQEIGESALKGPLPYDTVPPVDFDKWEHPLFKNDLRARSAARVAADPEFRYITEDLNELKKRLAENRVSLNEKARLAEIDEDKARRDQREAARAKVKQPDEKTYVITLDNLNKPDLQLVTYERPEKKGPDPKTGETKLEDGKSKEAKAPKTDSAKSPGEVKSTGDATTAIEPPATADPDDLADEDGETTNHIEHLDPIKTETLNILNDLIDLSHNPKTATASTAK